MIIKFIKHKIITRDELNNIVKVKSSAWPYSYQSQLNWMKTNLTDDDLHLLVKKDGLPIAYLNLISIEIDVDNKKSEGYGVGNVCTFKTGEGMGKKIMVLANEFLKKENKVGLLFCKENLINFYCKSGWELINKNKLKLPFNNTEIETMIYNSSHFQEIKLNTNIF
tara:strand:- start:10328 stop:10825 length:498 start_codon:yes stop_codon:yes gene_type:complete